MKCSVVHWLLWQLWFKCLVSMRYGTRLILILLNLLLITVFWITSASFMLTIEGRSQHLSLLVQTGLHTMSKFWISNCKRKDSWKMLDMLFMKSSGVKNDCWNNLFLMYITFRLSLLFWHWQKNYLEIIKNLKPRLHKTTRTSSTDACSYSGTTANQIKWFKKYFAILHE